MSTTKPENRKQLLELLGATQKNVQWSWCAVDEKHKRVFFTVWNQEQLNKNHKKDPLIYLVQQPWWGINETGNNSASRNDHNEKLRLYFQEKYTAYCYILKRKMDGSIPTLPVKIDGICDFIYRIELVEIPRLDEETGAPKENTIIGIVKYRIDRAMFSDFRNGLLN